jgi:signal transduction histidine kinase
MPKLIQELSLFSKGFSDRNRKFFLRINLLVIAYLVGYCIFYWSLGARLVTVILGVGALIISPTILIFEKFHYQVLARTLFLFSCMTYVYVPELLIGTSTLSSYFYIPGMIVTLLVFEMNHSKQITLSMGFPFFFWAIGAYGPKVNVSPFWINPDINTQILSFINAPAAMLLAGITLWLYQLHIEQAKNEAIEAIQSANLLSERVQEIAKIGGWELDVATLKTKWTEEVYRIHGVQPGTPTDVDMGVKFYNGADKKRIEGLVESAITEGKGFDDVFEFTDSKGQKKWVRSVGQPLRDSSGKIFKITGTFQDVTAQRKTELDLIQSGKMASLGEMAGGIAHEINNPLAVIHSKAWQIHKGIETEKLSLEQIKEGAKKIVHTADRISKIIKGLKSFSRNSEKDPFEKIKITRVIEETLELCQEKFRLHSIELRVNVDRELEVACRPAQLGQVLLNLLGNAHDAVLKTQNPWVEIGARRLPNGSVELWVMDSGNGIPGEVAEKIMQPFFTTKEVGKGTGLGLSISKGIVEEHSGHLSLDRASPNTRFTFALPPVDPSVAA